MARPVSFILIVIALFVLVVPSAAAQSPQAVPSITLSLSSGAPGAPLLVKGAGFSPASQVGVLVDTSSLRNTPIGQAMVAADGSVAVNVIIPPNIKEGNHSFWLVDLQNESIAASAVLPVNPVYRKAVFLYDSDKTSADAFKSLLDANGIATTELAMSAITSHTSFAAYDLILVGPDTGNNSAWGNAATLLAMVLTGKPILAMGEGGYAFLGKLGSPIGYPNGLHAAQVDTIQAVHVNDGVFQDPYAIPLVNSQVQVLAKAGPAVEIYLPQADSRTYPFAFAPGSPTYFPLVQSSRYMLWGFDDSPSNFTPEGNNLFINCVWYMLWAVERDTLVISNLNRMSALGATYPLADVTALENKLNELIGTPYPVSNMKAVRRDLSLDGTAEITRTYSAWNLSSVTSTNSVVTAIDQYVENLKRAAFPNVRYIILVGSHEIIPMKARQADNYDETSWGLPAGNLNTLLHTGTVGYYLTDTVYSDLSYYADGWGANSELVPELAVGRLVETPLQIVQLINNYLASSAGMSRFNRVAIGSDDYLDGAQAAYNAMGAGADDSLNQDGFTSNQVAPELTAKHGVVYIGGHGDYNWITTRKWDQGFQAGTIATQGDTEELGNLANAVIAAAGCHNGVIFPNLTYHNYDGTINYGEFPERLANKGVGVYVGATGYTWITLSAASKNVADVGFSERLTSLFIDHLLNDGGTTAGKAFQSAAKQYASERGTLGDADRRVLAIATFYGIPNYRWGSIFWPIARYTGYALKTIPLILTGSQAPEAAGATSAQVTLSLTDWSIQDHIVQIPGAAYTGDENTPILPVVTTSWNLPGTVSGVSLSLNQADSTFTDVSNDVPNAVVGTYTGQSGNEIYVQPQTVDLHGFYPTSVGFTTTTASLGGGDTSLSMSIIPVQYNPDTHTTRVWTKLVFDLSYTADANAAQVDSDSDGLPDYWENTYGLDPNSAVGLNGANGDPDQDHLTNQQELSLGTNPTNPDTDMDGVSDGLEFMVGTDPLDPGSTPRSTYLPAVTR